MASNRFEAETRQAIAEAARAYEQNNPEIKKKRAHHGIDYFYDAIRFLMTLAAIAIVIGLIDGARREYTEYYANLAGFKPPVAVRRVNDKLPVQEKMELHNKDAVSTAATGTATIAFPDGSAVIVEPKSKFEVQLLDYNRGPRRDRSFLLRSGSVFTRISKLFGKKGQTLICTPNAVAAARGTGFSTKFDPSTNTTFVEVIDGVVALRNAGGRVEIKKGQTGTAVGSHPPTLGVSSRGKILAQRFANLGRFDKKEMPLETYERYALNLLNPALQIIALTPHGFAPDESDWSRKANTRSALKVLQQAFEAVQGEVPDALNPVTMKELGLNDAERERILKSVAGFSIDRYEKRSLNSYRVLVRSRDTAWTVFELTENGVREISGI